MALKYHPDVCHPSEKEESARIFVELHEAYKTLLDPMSREEHDHELSMRDFAGTYKIDVGGDQLERKRWKGQIVELRRRSVLDDYPNVAMDTEFPGTIIFSEKHYSCLFPSDNYFLMKSNVDALNLIQVGLTLSDNQGNLPDLYTDSCYVWQFNFRDFDIESDDLRNADSIKLLKGQGIDFKRNREEGIDSREFAEMLLWSGLVYKRPLKRWVTFHSGYDFGFLIKMLTHRELPENLETFMAMVHYYFGGNVYDIKHLMRDCNGLNGGLERAAKALVLSLSSNNAGIDEIKRAYRTMVLKYHPDVCHPSEKKESASMFVELHEAYKTLLDPVSREEHDHELSMGDFARTYKIDVGSDQFERKRWKGQIVELRRRSGTIVFSDKHYSCLSPSDNYFLMKSNVDALNLIQVGLTLSDNQGNLPDLYTDSCYVWQFNFRDFDIESDDPRNADSIKLLKRQGIDFKRNREEGIDSREFAEMLLWSGLVYKRPLKRWVTFHSGYDFGFLIKMLTHRELPENLETFMAMVHYYFGGNVYDIKHLMRDCNGLNGGLERVAKALGVDRTIIFSEKHYSCLSPSDNYFLMKSNVDALNLIQVGLTLSDNQGNLPDLYTDSCYVWQFNFRDFDIESDDLRNADSNKLLKWQGIDFKRNREEGIDSREFAEMLLWSGLVYKRPLKRWVTFHSGYDFGFLIKMLTHRELPENLETFMAMVHYYFGGNVYDIKHLMRDCNGLNGGLERVAKALGVDRSLARIWIDISSGRLGISGGFFSLKLEDVLFILQASPCEIS
ncbi:hypothetical protein ACSBR2_022042 [Camellia fascicularis]